MRTIKTSVEEIIERTIELARRYSVRQVLINKESFKLNETVINDYEDFFATTDHALFESFTIITYQLYENTRSRTITIPSVINELRSSYPIFAKNLDTRIDKLQPILNKIFAIRCGIYAHRSQKKTPREIFNSHGVSLRQMEKIVVTTTGIVASLADAVKIGTRVKVIKEINKREMCASDDTVEMMKMLREHAA